MLKQLTIAALVGALLPACILTTDDTTTSDSASTTNVGTSTASTSDTNPTTTTVDPTTTTDGTSTTVSMTSTDGTTTDTPTTDGTTVETTTDGTTTVATEATTGMGGAYGQCGWFAADKYYACSSDGAVASLEDPDGISAIACPDGLEEGGKCSEEEGPVKGVGCCTTEGVLYFCDSEGALTIIKQECGL